MLSTFPFDLCSSRKILDYRGVPGNFKNCKSVRLTPAASSSSAWRRFSSALRLLPPPTAGAASRAPHPATFLSHASPSTFPTSAPLFPCPLPRLTRTRRRRAVATELPPWPAPHRAPNSYVARASAPLGAPRPILAIHSPAPRP
jgi:hypothetical protein